MLAADDQGVGHAAPRRRHGRVRGLRGGAGRARGTGAARTVVHQRFRLDRPGVGQGAALRVVRGGQVREAAVLLGEDGLGVVALAEGLPDLGALGDAVLLLGGEEGECVVHLAAAARAEEGADDGGQRDQVGALEVLDGAGVGDGVLVAGQHVLAGEVTALVGGVDVGVDARDVGVHVGQGQLAALTGLGGGALDLRLQVVLGVGGAAPELLLQALVGGGAAREGGQLAASDVSEEVHEPQPVLGRGVSGAELGAVAGGAGDVRHAGLLVADDGDVVASGGADGGGDLAGRDAEGGVVEEGVDLVVGEAGVAGGEVRVGAELVLGVRGLGAERLVEEDLGEGGVAVLAGRQDVGTLPAAVVVGGGFGGRDLGGRVPGGRRRGKR
ncbi:hypothetical protein RKD37_006956 [Streptomyces ambofaciens]